MKKTFILIGCLLSMTLLQAEPLSTGCCGCKKKKRNHERHFVQTVNFNGGCGCGGGAGAGTGSNEIPPNNE